MAFGKKNYNQKINLDGHQLSYIGSGIRKALIFDLYSAALYANETFDSPQEAIDKDVPKILVTNILTPLLNGTMLSQVFKDALSKTHYGQQPEIKNDVEAILQLFRNGKIARFDKFEFLCSPDNGFTAYQNGIKKLHCPNPILSKAILEVYLGSYHTSQELPRKIVGL